MIFSRKLEFPNLFLSSWRKKSSNFLKSSLQMEIRSTPAQPCFSQKRGIRAYYFPTNPFTILKPQDQEIGLFLYFRKNVVRRILKLQNCERIVGHTTYNHQACGQVSDESLCIKTREAKKSAMPLLPFQPKEELVLKSSSWLRKKSSSFFSSFLFRQN